MTLVEHQQVTHLRLALFSSNSASLGKGTTVYTAPSSANAVPTNTLEVSQSHN